MWRSDGDITEDMWRPWPRALTVSRARSTSPSTEVTIRRVNVPRRASEMRWD
jgi:hypothetical protein